MPEKLSGFRIPEDLKQRAMEAAKRQHISFSAFVEKAIRQALEQGASLEVQIQELRRRVEELERIVKK